MSKLEEILQAEVAAEIEAILREADSRAQEIVREAENRVAKRLAARRQQMEAAARAAGQQARSAAELSVANARLQAQGEVMDLLRQKVGRALEATAASPGYGQVLQALAQEAMGVVAAAEAVVVNPEDGEKLRDWARGQGLELRTDPGLRLGVRIVSPGGATVENTLPERLHRAWNTLGPGVTRLLWE